MLLSKYSDQLQRILSNSLKDTKATNYEIVSTTTPEKLFDVLFFLKNSTYSQFTLLTDITAYDRPECPERFTLVYNLLRPQEGLDKLTPYQVAKLTYPNLKSTFYTDLPPIIYKGDEPAPEIVNFKDCSIIAKTNLQRGHLF